MRINGLMCVVIGLVSLLCLPVTAGAEVPVENARPISRKVYLVGNTAGIKPDSDYLRSLQAAITQEKDSFILIFTGDILDNNGMSDEPLNEKDSLRLKALMGLAKLNPRGQTYFIPGDRDWGNSSKDGLKRRKYLEDYIEAALGKGVFQPSNGCPGPELKESGAHLSLIFLDTQWWIHPHKKPAENDASCKIINPDDFWEELEDIISSTNQQNVLILGHHPVYSNGAYGGHKMWKKHLFPFTDIHPKAYFPLPGLGSIYAAFRQNVGTPRDMAYHRYQDFTDHLRNVLTDHNPLIYASGHEYNTQVLEVNGNYYVNSGTAQRSEPVGRSRETVFKEKAAGIVVLKYYADGGVDVEVLSVDEGKPETSKELALFHSPCLADSNSQLVNTSYIPCKEEVITAPVMNRMFYDSTTYVVAGAEYDISEFKQWFKGWHWRPSWLVPVRVPYLNLDTAFGGLKPLGKGGGSQTLSLKFKGGNGYEYVFRSVNKNPRKALPYDLRGTVVENLIKDQTTTQHPYGALVVSYMLDRTEILHAQPKLYLLPNDPKLGPFQKDFGNLFGLMEIRPQKPDGKTPGFKGADDVDRSFQFFRKVYDDHDVKLSAPTFAKARVFDIWIGDWGKHQENWKWAGYEENGKWIYYPIPRDRDHAFSRWDGLFPWLADREWAKQNVQNFGYDYKGIKSLTFQARHMDRFLLSEMDWADFEKAVTDLRSQITDAVIDSAIAQLPIEDRNIAGPELAGKLKHRREKLMEAAREYYEYLARYVDVKGSNKREIFEIERLEDGNVKVTVYDDKNGKKGEQLYERTFIKGETKEIRVYGLGKDDKISITGKAKRSILVRVVGGTGEDKVTDNSKVKGLCRKTLVYDSSDKDTLDTGSEAKHLSPKVEVDYNRKDFEYNTYLVIPKLGYNRDNGFGIGVGVNWVKQKFHKPLFARKHSIGGMVTTQGTYTFTYKGLYHHVFGKFDIGMEGLYDGLSALYPHFFGIGNETTYNRDLYRADFYRNIQHYLTFSPTIQRRFFQRSFISVGPVYEYSNVIVSKSGGAFDMVEGGRGPYFRGLGMMQFAGGQATLDLDFRDNSYFTRKGMQIYARHSSFAQLNGAKDNYGVTEGFVSFYHTVRIGLPVTLALKGGGETVYGEAPFYKLATLGQSDNLRGYLRNRFAGTSSAYLNSELRLHLGKVKNSFLPFFYGIYGFYDLGRVWVETESGKKLHMGYGGGLYFAPVTESLSLNFSFAHSEEEKFLFQFGLGFFIQ